MKKKPPKKDMSEANMPRPAPMRGQRTAKNKAKKAK